ncbi:MAG: putative multicopper oxidase [Acidimicrobiales bacterium]|nr:putative multicopper oxidase [Acidimicrobiales bacterium]
MGALGSAAVLLPLERLATAAAPARMAASNLPRPFTIPFTLPPVARPSRWDPDSDTDHYAMDMVQVNQSILPGYTTAIWAYQDHYGNLNPTIDVAQGRQVRVQQCNQLPNHPQLGYAPSTSVHLHGSASLPQYDGYAGDVTSPGNWKDYYYPDFQDARTLWYHDHGAHHTASNVFMGLAAMYRIFDPLEQSLPIPHGRYDVPLIVRDAMFDTSGQLLYNDHDHSGVYGDVILVNGKPWPVMKVERRKYRFRILNASVSRSYRWQLDSGQPLTVIGTDGGLCPAPVPVNQFRHGVAERYEVIIDFARYPIGRRVVLKNLSNKNNIDFANTNKVMAFDVVAEATSQEGNSIPSELNPGNDTMNLTEAMSTQSRRFDLVRTHGRWTINGKTWQDIIDSDFRWVAANPKPNAIEVWEFRNLSGGWNHPLHVHLIDFKILDRNGKPPLPHERGPKDVAYIGENESVRVIAKFKNRVGRYMIHCHNLVHEDHDMMTQFEVGEDGDDPIYGEPTHPLPATPV